jgi:hypothetical protein
MSTPIPASVIEADNPQALIRALQVHGIRVESERAQASIARATAISIRLTLTGAIAAMVTGFVGVIGPAAGFPALVWLLIGVPVGFAVILSSPVFRARAVLLSEPPGQPGLDRDLAYGLDEVGGFPALAVRAIWPHQGQLGELQSYAQAYVDTLPRQLTPGQLDTFLQLAKDGYTGTFGELVATCRTLD